MVWVDCDPPKELSAAGLDKWRADKLSELRAGKAARRANVDTQLGAWVLGILEIAPAPAVGRAVDVDGI